MDETSRPLSTNHSSPGGSVEPAQTSNVSMLRPDRSAPGHRYELHDPFAETTYRSDRFDEIAKKADQLGATRFTAIDAQGHRTPVTKGIGRWQPAPATVQPHLSSSVSQARNKPAPSIPPTRKAPDPSDSMDWQAEHAAWRARLESGLAERYVIKRPVASMGDIAMGHTEYRFRGDVSRVAFTESTFRLATDTNSPSVARSMVDLAEARSWQTLKVSGSEDFRRTIWLEAAARSIKAVGYEPLPTDLEALKKVREARLVNRVEPINPEAQGAAATKGNGRGGGGRKAVLAAIEQILVAKGVSAEKRQLVLVAAEGQLAERVRKGQVPAVKVHDPASPPRTTTPHRPSTREHAVERPTPAR